MKSSLAALHNHDNQTVLNHGLCEIPPSARQLLGQNYASHQQRAVSLGMLDLAVKPRVAA